MIDQARSARFVSAVGWVFLLASALGLLVSGAQVLLLSRAAPGFSVDGQALALTLALVALSGVAVVVSVAFLRRRRWARGALVAIAALGIAASFVRLFSPAPSGEPPPPDAPAEYLRLLRLAAIVDFLVPALACLALGWIIWRLQSPAVRDQFR